MKKKTGRSASKKKTTPRKVIPPPVPKPVRFHIDPTKFFATASCESVDGDNAFTPMINLLPEQMSDVCNLLGLAMRKVHQAIMANFIYCAIDRWGIISPNATKGILLDVNNIGDLQACVLELVKNHADKARQEGHEEGFKAGKKAGAELETKEFLQDLLQGLVNAATDR